MADNAMTVMIEEAQIIFRNFEGKEGQYNRKGDRNFSAILDDKTAQTMLEDGWNVKYLEARDEGDNPVPYIPVAVNFENRPPRITLIASDKRTNITEDMVDILDGVDIAKCDFVIRAYNWEVNGKTGVKAYLKTMFVTIEEDELEKKYARSEVRGDA